VCRSVRGCSGEWQWSGGGFECSSIGGCSGDSRLQEVRRVCFFEFFSKRWKGSLLQVFVDGAAFVVGRVVAIAEYTSDIVRFLFPLALCSMMATGALDTSGAAEAISLRMPVALAFATLRNSSFRPRWFEFNFGIMQSLNEVDGFVVWTRFQVDKEQWKRDICSALLNVKYIHHRVSKTFDFRLDVLRVSGVVQPPKDRSKTSIRLRLIRVKLCTFFGESFYYC